MNQENKPLTHRQQLAIAEILSSPSLEEARRRIKAAKGTFYGWLKDVTFPAELKRQREDLVEQAFNRLKSGLVQAVDKLLALLAVEDKPGIQLRAAQTLLDQGIKAVELQELESRLGVLEEEIAAKRERGWR